MGNIPYGERIGNNIVSALKIDIASSPIIRFPVENDLRLVWLLGMLAATALEYVVGAAMERLFQVRYWDYSKHRFNLHGYICLSSSIAWGFFSILLVRRYDPQLYVLDAGTRKIRLFCDKVFGLRQILL